MLKKILILKFLIIIVIPVLLLCLAFIFRKPISLMVTRLKFSVTASTHPVKLNNEGLIKPIEAKGLPEGVHAGIYPRIELVAGALSQTGWNTNRRPIGRGNKYYRDIKTYFSFYRGHKAIQLTEKLRSAGMQWDYIPNFMLTYGKLPSLTAPKKYPSDILNKINNNNDLNSFAPAFSDLSKEMNFPGFFEAHRNEFQGYVDKAVKDFDAPKIIDWINNFFGEISDKGDFYLIFTPSIFPYVDNLFNVPGPESRIAIVRAGTENKDEVVFPSGMDLSLLALHEWGHFCADPYIEINEITLVKNNILDLYIPVQKLVSSQGYQSVSAFFEEELLRGTVALAAKDLYGEKAYKEFINKSNKDYFYLTAFTAEQLDYYRKNKDKYKNLNEFMPYLLEQFNINRNSLLKQAP